MSFKVLRQEHKFKQKHRKNNDINPNVHDLMAVSAEARSIIYKTKEKLKYQFFFVFFFSQTSLIFDSFVGPYLHCFFF